MAQAPRDPGWDTQASRDIADLHYGGFVDIFEADDLGETRGLATKTFMGGTS